MCADDHVATHIALQRHQLREKLPGKDARVAPHAVMGQAHDMVRMRPEIFELPPHGVLLQKRLIRHLI